MKNKKSGVRSGVEWSGVWSAWRIGGMKFKNH